jgi:hypothetical protein
MELLWIFDANTGHFCTRPQQLISGTSYLLNGVTVRTENISGNRPMVYKQYGHWNNDDYEEGEFYNGRYS